MENNKEYGKLLTLENDIIILHDFRVSQNYEQYYFDR